MKKRIGILGVCMALLLTGCGMPDAVEDEWKKLARLSGFSNGTKEEQGDLGDWISNYEEGEEYKEKIKVSEQREKELDALAGFLEEKQKEELIYVGEVDYDIHDYEEDGVEDISTDSDEKADLTADFQELREWRNYDYMTGDRKKVFMGNASSISGYFSVEKNKMGDFLEGMEEIGFVGLKVPEGKDKWYTHQVCRGIEFDITEENENTYSVSYQLSEDSIAYPEKYTGLLEDHMRDAFSLARVMCGGDLEFIAFRGSQCEPDSSYNKNVEIYFKDRVVLQMNLLLQENYDEGEGEFFTEREQKDLTGLLTWLTGDAAGSESFIKGFGESREKEGTLGDRKWYRTKAWGSGEEYVRFQ